MQPLRIVIDVRHIKDFGIGTYIRNLVSALGELDHVQPYPAAAIAYRYTGISSLRRRISRRSLYHEPEKTCWDNTRLSLVSKGLAPDLVHLPLNDVPLFMRNPYVVTIHDMSSFLFGADRNA